MALAETLQAPVVHALRGKEFVEYDNPYDVGMTGLLGFASGYKAIKEAEVLLMLGTDFPYRQFYPENAPSSRWTSAAGTWAGARRSISAWLAPSPTHWPRWRRCSPPGTTAPIWTGL